MVSDFQYNESDKTGTLTLDGELTIENIVELKIAFMEALTKSNQLTIDHSRANVFDFAYVQLLCAVNKTAGMLNKNLVLAESGSEEFKKLIKESGFNNIAFFK